MRSYGGARTLLLGARALVPQQPVFAGNDSIEESLPGITGGARSGGASAAGGGGGGAD